MIAPLADASPGDAPLVDQHGRSIAYLRVSVTDRCNFRCVYCMPLAGLPWLPRETLLTDDEIVAVVRELAPLGLRRVRLTGGEPTLRPGLVELVARQLWNQAGLGPDGIDAAVLYDAFTPMVLLQLEEYGFCGRGEAKDYIADGHVDLDGVLPINTHGGQLGEGYIQGVNGIAEGVRLIRGTSVNQPAKEIGNVLVTGGSPVPHSAIVLPADR